MAVKIRLRQHGRSNRAFYRIVVTDVRSPRDGKYIESVGWYDPLETEAEKHLKVNEERIQYWLDHGAELTERAALLVKKAAPEVMRKEVEKEVARRAKRLAQKKA